MSTKQWLSAQDLASRYEVHIELIHKLRKDGLPAVKVGRSYRFDADEADAWLRQQDQSSRPEPAVEPDWLATQLAKFTPDDLRRAGEVLISLSRTIQTAGGR